MGAFHNPAITEVLPEVSYTIRPADSSYAHDARHKSWFAANMTVVSAGASSLGRCAMGHYRLGADTSVSLLFISLKWKLA